LQISSDRSRASLRTKKAAGGRLFSCRPAAGSALLTETQTNAGGYAKARKSQFFLRQITAGAIMSQEAVSFS
jgi:hypothetical protein